MKRKGCGCLLPAALLLVVASVARAQVCLPYSGGQCVGYGTVDDGVQGSAEFGVLGGVAQLSVVWFNEDCKAAIRKIMCAYNYRTYNCGTFTYCATDCMALANSVCSDYIEGDQQFATALLGACMSLDSTPGCVSSEFEVETLDIDKTSCPKPLEVRPRELGPGEYLEVVPHSGCTLPCLNALFTPEDQDLVRNFGLTMSVTSLVFCTVALWVFLTQPDIATRRKSVVTGSTATNSTRNSGQGRPSVDGFNLRASIAEMGSSFHQFVERAKAGKLLAGHSKANRWKLVLFAGAWVNALYSMIYDIMDIQNPVGCRGEAIILRYQPFAVLKAAINFWVHFFSILIMGYLARNLYLSALGMSEVGPRVEKEFSRVLAVIFFLSFAVVGVCLGIGQYGYDFGTSSAFMMQTHEREPLWVIVSLLGGLNLIAAAFVFMFLYHVPYRAVPKSAMMLVASFLLYFLTSAAFVGLSIHVFAFYAGELAKPALRGYVECLLSTVMFADDPLDAGIKACGSYASEDRINIGSFLYFKLWQSGYSILTCLAWAPLISRRVWAMAKAAFVKQPQEPLAPGKTSNRSDQRQPTPRARSGSIRKLANEAENDFSRIAANVRKGWEAVKNVMSGHKPSSQLEEGYGERPSNQFGSEREDEVDALFEKERRSSLTKGVQMLPTIPSAQEFSEFPLKPGENI